MGGDHDPIHVSYDSLDDLKRQLGDLSLAFGNTQPAVTSSHDNISTGAGDMAVVVSDGLAEFTAAWTAALKAWSEASALISNNAGQASLDFSKTDVAYTSDIQL